MDASAAGCLRGATVWRGEVDLAGDVLIPAGSTLTLAAGTRIVARSVRETPYLLHRFGAEVTERGRCQLLIEGELRAEGTSDEPVRAGGAAWGGIRVFGRARADLRALISEARPREALHADDFARVRAAGCRFEGGLDGAHVSGFARARFRRCEFRGGGRAALRASEDAQIEAVSCAARAPVGLRLADSARASWLRGRAESEVGAQLSEHARLRSSGSLWTSAKAGLEAGGRSAPRSRADRFAGPGRAAVEREGGRVERAAIARLSAP